MIPAVVETLPLIGAAITVAFGLLGLFLPGAAAGLVGIEPKPGIGRSEVRATYGGLFVGVGLACLWLQSTEAFLVAGGAWLGAAGARALAIAVDREPSAGNFGGLAVEAVVGGMLLSALA